VDRRCGVLNAQLGGIDVEHPPEDGAPQHLPQRLRCFEAVSRTDRHPPGGDLMWLQLVEPPLAEGGDRMGEQPAQLSSVTGDASC